MISNSEKYIIDEPKLNQTEGKSNYQNSSQVKPFSPVINHLNQKRTDILNAIDANYDKASMQQVSEILAKSDVEAVSKAADAVI